MPSTPGSRYEVISMNGAANAVKAGRNAVRALAHFRTSSPQTAHAQPAHDHAADPLYL